MSINNKNTSRKLQLNKQTLSNLQGDAMNHDWGHEPFPVIVPRKSPARFNKVAWPYHNTYWCDFAVSAIKRVA